MIDLLNLVCLAHGYGWRPGLAKGPFDLFVFGVRHPNRVADAWDDILGCAWIGEDGKQELEVWRGTTDTGAPHLKRPLHPSGAAILPPGQYRGSHRLGLHKGKSPALVQATALPVFRDGDRDFYVDPVGRHMLGWYGINIHGPWREGLPTVGEASAGCQVFHRGADLDRLLDLVKLQAAHGLGEAVTYTLFDGGEDPDLMAFFVGLQ